MMHLSKENTGILSESLYHTLEQYCHPFSALPKPSPLSSWKLPNDTDEEYEKLEEEIDRNHPESTCGVGVTNTIFETKGRESPLKGAIQYIYGEFAYLLSPSLPGMSSYTTENVQRTAIVSRLIVLFIQIFASYYLPPHINDGFKTSRTDIQLLNSAGPTSNVVTGSSGFTRWDPQENLLHIVNQEFNRPDTCHYQSPGIKNGKFCASKGGSVIPPSTLKSLVDSAVNMVVGGFASWDGQYFLHIATQGYTHENTMAFFPLFPITVGILAKMLHFFLFPLISVQSIAILVGSVFNIWFFMNAAVALSQIVRKQTSGNVSYLLPTTIYLFCYNPASIFFSAFYSESLFAWLTFSCVLELYNKNFPKAILCASFSLLCRSNGLLNFGIIGIAFLGIIASEKASICEGYLGRKLLPNLSDYRDLSRIVSFGIRMGAGLIPFAIFQYFCVKNFCRRKEDYDASTFCQYNGLPYSYIQKTNWNVGFLQYYEAKQIPNFLLAAPVLSTLGLASLRHAKSYRRSIFEMKAITYENILELSLACHGLFLTLFCLYFIHVQVSTRLILSACPYIYIYIAKSIQDERSLFLSRIISWTPYSTFINGWFILYFLIGTTAFSLGYPWT